MYYVVEWGAQPLGLSIPDSLSWLFVFMEALCQPGSYSPTKMEPCFLCDKGYYQTKEGQSSCLECSPNKTTSAEGSNSSTQCGGMYWKTGNITSNIRTCLPPQFRHYYLATTTFFNQEHLVSTALTSSRYCVNVKNDGNRINLSYGFTCCCFRLNLKIFILTISISHVLLINYFPQFHARLDHFRQLDWLHVIYAIDALFSHVMRVVCVLHAREQL